jgi:hypothetical protein
MKQLKKRINDLFERTIESGYDIANNIDFENLDYYNLYSNAIQSNCAITLNEKDNLFFLNHKHDNKYGILIIYMLNNLDTNKKVSEKIINLLSIFEDLFITLDTAIVKSESSATYLVVYKDLSKLDIGGIELCQ